MAIIDKVLDNTVTGLSKVLDLQWRRNEALASNISNTETPQYRATDLNFSGELERAFGESDNTLARTNAKHLDIVDNTSAHLVADLSGATKADGNNVDVDIQMGKLALNGDQFSMNANLLRKKLKIIMDAIRSAQR